MILGKISGKVTTKQFTFEAVTDAKNFEYVQVCHKSYGFVLCQIVELVRDADRVVARCHVIGYKDENGIIKSVREPFEVAAEVLRAQDEFIESIVKLSSSDRGALIGRIEGRDIPIRLDLQTLLTKHLAVLAKSGAGKSYSVGVLLEEIIEKRVPLLVIDPHGEYSSLKYRTEVQKDVDSLARYGLKPKGFSKRIQVYGDPEHNEDVKILTVSDTLTVQELLHLLPSKMSTTQEGLLYSTLKNFDHVDFDQILQLLDAEDSPGKWHIIKMIDYLKNLKIFSKSPTPYNELIQGGRCSIINLRGITPQVQEIIVYKLLKDLFEERKQGKIPPFFCVIEEAHNFCPERAFGHAKSSDILRTIASEGRKFGLGICIISQRPARVDKSVLSQVSTQIILKVTNPNDLKAISQSVEGLTSDSEQEIQNLAIGQALITGVVDVPLFISVRPRMSMHGGASVDILENSKNDDQFFDEIKEFEQMDLIPIIPPAITKRDFQIMNDLDEKSVKVHLVPCAVFMCQQQSDFMLLFERVGGSVVKNIDTFELGKLPEIESLAPHELAVLRKAFDLKKFQLAAIMHKGFGMDVSDVLGTLVKKEYLTYDAKTKEYSTDAVYILSNLKRYQVYKKIEYKSIPFDEKLHAEFSVDDLKRKLSKFVTVLDLRECFLIRYAKA